MKVKSILSYGLLLLGAGAATTSCQDAFTADSNMVTTELAPQDTVYQMMGIVKKMQVLAERTVVLGELRADLVDVPTQASISLQDLKKNAAGVDNAYNKPVDYYSVINACNIYLKNADPTIVSNGKHYYEREIAAAKTYRAWAYLELAKIYGTVPFVTEPVLTAGAAEDIVNDQSSMKTMDAICDFLINDLGDYKTNQENEKFRQSYSAKWTSSTSSTAVSYSKFFIPARLMLAELYLWRGSYTQNVDDYKSAARLYYDYLTFSDVLSHVSTHYYQTSWQNKLVTSPSELRESSGYNNLFSVNNEDQIAIIPLDTMEYYGNTCDLKNIFCSQYSNNYYASAVPSSFLKELSASQTYCIRYNEGDKDKGIQLLPNGQGDEKLYREPLQMGDLRLSSVYETVPTSSKYSDKFNTSMQIISKYTSGSLSMSSLSTDKKIDYVTLYRASIIWLHFAEALNRAGYPETAFAILKYGLSNSLSEYISSNEYDNLKNLKSFYSDTLTLAHWNYDQYRWYSSASYEGTKGNDPSTLLSNGEKSTVLELYQGGIHSYGSGCSDVNPEYELDDATIKSMPGYVEAPDYQDYYSEELIAEILALDKLPLVTPEDTVAYQEAVAIIKETYKDEITKYSNAVKAYEEFASSETLLKARQARVAQAVLDEEALEGMFEGHRFYDLMRYAFQTIGTQKNITIPDYLKKYSTADYSTMEGKQWYLPLPTR